MNTILDTILSIVTLLGGVVAIIQIYKWVGERKSLNQDTENMDVEANNSSSYERFNKPSKFPTVKKEDSIIVKYLKYIDTAEVIGHISIGWLIGLISGGILGSYLGGVFSVVVLGQVYGVIKILFMVIIGIVGSVIGAIIGSVFMFLFFLVLVGGIYYFAYAYF